MKYFITLLFGGITLFLSQNLYSQNCDIISNWDFENYSSCPNALSQINRAVGWYDANASGQTYPSADYFNCSFKGTPSSGTTPPAPASGTGYIGINVAAPGSSGGGAEMAGAFATLCQGVQYQLSFKSIVNFNYGGNESLKILGVNTSSFPVATTSSFCPLNATTLLTIPKSDVVNSTWVSRSYTFTSPANFNAIIIGGNCGSSDNYYIYIDDFRIQTVNGVANNSTISSTSTISCQNNIAAVRANLPNCYGPYTITVNVNGVDQVFTGVNNGDIANFTINGPTSIVLTQAISSNGCVSNLNSTLNFNLPSSPTASISPSATTVCVGGNFTLSGSGGGSYTWTGPGVTPSNEHNQVLSFSSVTPSQAGTYTLQVTDVNGCTDTKQVAIQVIPKPTVSLTASQTAICVGQSVTLTASGATTYSWTGAGTSGSGAIQTVSPSATSTYTIVGDASGSCPSELQSIVVNVDQPPVLNTSGINGLPSACGANTGVINGITVTSPSSGYSVSWEDSFGQEVSTNLSPTNLGAGSYTLNVSHGACTTSYGPVTVLNSSGPVVSVVPSVPGGICEGESITLTASGASSYVWSNGATGNAITVSPTASQTYSVTGTTSGCDGVNSYNVVVNPKPTLSITASDLSVCAGDGVTITASGATSYTWNNGLSAGSTHLVNPIVTTTYQVTGSDANNCGSDPESITITVNPDENAQFNYAQTVVCQSASVISPTISGTQGGTFSATPSGLIINASTGEVNLAASVAGTYQIQYTTSGACPDSDSQTLTISSPTPSDFSYQIPAYCQENGVIPVIIASGSQAGTFSSTTGLSINSSTGAINFTQSSPGTYIVTNTIPAMGACPASSSTFEVTVNPTPSASIGFGNNSSFCPGAPLDLTAFGAGPNGNYSWTGPNDFISNQQNPTIENAGVDASGIYQVMVENEFGCVSTAAINISIVDNNPPTFLSCVGPTSLFVSEGECTLMVPDFTSYQGLTIVDDCDEGGTSQVTVTQSLMPGLELDLGEHIIWIYAEDNSGNIDSCSFVLTVVDAIAPTFVNGCINDTTVVANSANCDYILPDFFATASNLEILDNCDQTSTESITLTQTPAVGTHLGVGTHTIWLYATDASGNTGLCSFQLTIEGTLPELPVLSLETYSVCLGEDATLEVGNADEVYSYSWVFEGNTVGTGASLTIPNSSSDNAGEYTLIATNDSGCQASISAELLVEYCKLFIPEALSPNGDGMNDYFTIEGLGAYPNTEVWIYNRWGLQVFHSDDYQNDWDGSSHNGMTAGKDVLPEGTYYYIIKFGGEDDAPLAGEVEKGFVYLKR